MNELIVLTTVKKAMQDVLDFTRDCLKDGYDIDECFPATAAATMDIDGVRKQIKISVEVLD